jgi:hypothetical protein
MTTCLVYGNQTWLKDWHGDLGPGPENQIRDMPAASPPPSWSWASRPGNSITYSDINSVPGSEMEIDYSIGNRGDRPERRQEYSFFEVLSVESMRSSTGSSGPAISGSLRMRGLVLEARPTETSVAKFDRGTVNCLLVIRPIHGSSKQIYKQFLGEAFYDEPVSKGEKLYRFLLGLDTRAERRRSPPSDTNAQLRRHLFGNKSDNHLASMQNSFLENWPRMLPTMTWRGAPVPCCTLERENLLSCLILKKIDAEEMKFRRVGYVQVKDGQCFEEAVPCHPRNYINDSTLET